MKTTINTNELEIKTGEKEEPPDSSQINEPPGFYFAKQNKVLEPKVKGFYFAEQNKVLESKTKGFYFAKQNKVEIISDIETCYSLWQEFSPKETLFDTWEFRYAFYLGYKYKPYFILLKRNNEVLGILPLWHDLTRKKYFWFGSDWQEENKFFVKDKIFLPLLLNLAPSPLFLNAIDSKIPLLSSKFKFLWDDSKYILELKNFKSSEDFLMSLKKNRRRDLRKDRNRILKQNPKIVFNRFSDFKKLVNLAKKRFAQKGESVDWKDKRRVETFSQVINLKGLSYELRMLSVYIGRKIAGVDLIALYGNTYYALKCGYDVKNFPGIGNFINLIEIDDALKLNLGKIDFLQNNYQWKSRWFQEVPLLKYEK